MRPKVLEISWHEAQAVYSCDFQPLPIAQLKRLLSEDDDKEKDKSVGPIIAGGRQYRLATAGGDSKVRLWLVHPNIPSSSASAQAALTGQDLTPHPPRAEYLATLSKHTAAVNVVRFSPNGATLASAGDDGNVILWVPSDKPQTGFGETSSDDVVDKEFWRAQRILQVTTKHVYDLAWSPDSEFLIAGSTDNTASIWKAGTGECVYALREHQHNVQGVAWDPLNEYIATQSSDRSVHVNTFGFRSGMPDVHPVSRATRMEIRHSRTPSFPSGSRPNLARRGSNVSEAGSAITSASEFTEPPQPIPRHLATPMTPSASASIPSTPQPMDPPASSTKPGSRRSSFSGSQAANSPSLSTTAFVGRAGRSPSPIPPLPAVRPPANAHSIMQRLYGEEGVTRFFRRLTFSPDGSLLLTPAGQIEDQVFKASPMLLARSLSQDGSEPSLSVPKPKNAESGKPTVYIYSRGNLSKNPVAHLPGHKTSSVAIRFSPIFYDLRTALTSAPGQSEPKQITLDRNDPGPINVSLSMPPPPPPSSKDKDAEKEKEKPLGSIFALPYRLLYAVACQDAVLLYDTQQAGPIAIFKGLHYAGFTDVAWSPDGQSLMLSSADGYCSIVVFDMAELGTVHATQQHHRQLQAIAQSHAHPIPSSSTSTPMPHSPAVSISTTTRQSPAPARSEREGSNASSIAVPPPPAHMGHGLVPPASLPPSSSTSSVEPALPTPSEENEGFAFPRLASESESGASVSASVGTGSGTASGSAAKTETAGSGKRHVEEGEAPKKKRRVVLSKVTDE